MATIPKMPGVNTSIKKMLKLLPNHTSSQFIEENTRKRPKWPQSFLTLALIALLMSGLALLLGPAPRALAAFRGGDDGHVYVLNNNLSGSNSITVFTRQEDGSLKLLGTTSIGGLGSVTAFADGTQGSLILTQDERTRLFAVDAGTNQVSVVNVNAGHLSLVGVFSSGGAGPVSLTYRDDLLYVLNAANTSTAPANVAGFYVDDKGKLHRIPGATRLLSTAHPNPAQIQIDPSGRFLLVTEKKTNLIDVYRIHDDGSLSSLTTFPATGVYPFGMAFDPASPHEFLVDDAVGGPNNTGGVTAYRLVHGTVGVINGPVYDYQAAPCWMVITQDGRYAYTTDSYSQVISGYRIHADGKISLLDANGVTGITPSNTNPIEEALGDNSRFLYVLDSRLLLTPPGPATLSGFLIHSNGSLTPVINPAHFTLPLSAIGLATD